MGFVVSHPFRDEAAERMGHPAFSKKLENHEHMLAIYFLYYNFCRVHQTLRVTPAMEAGISNHVWGIQELVELLESKSILDGLKQAS
jgi:hypothetical protein